MPSLHNINIKDLKLSDFPQFSCLCELCDCGCFERGKNVHAESCKKKKIKKYISNAIRPLDDDSKNSNLHSLYNDTYVKFDLGAGKVLSESAHSSPRKSNKDRTDQVEPLIGRRSAKLSTKTTNSEHFQMWNSNPAPLIHPSSDHASDIIYPNHERNLVTTNDQLLFKKYGNFKAKQSMVNQFEGSFKINQGRMSFDSSYNHDFPERKEKTSRPKLVSRHDVEKRTEEYSGPMYLQTQTMLDYSYDPTTFRSVWIPKKLVPGAKNLFVSHLSPHLNPYAEYDDPIRRSSYSLEYSGKSARSDTDITSPIPSISTIKKFPDDDKSVRFVKSFDNSQVPMLRVLETLPTLPLKFSKIPPIKRSQNSPSGSLASSIDCDDSVSTYQAAYKKTGMDICMAKAYRLLENNKTKNDQTTNSLISIKE